MSTWFSNLSKWILNQFFSIWPFLNRINQSISAFIFKPFWMDSKSFLSYLTIPKSSLCQLWLTTFPNGFLLSSFLSDPPQIFSMSVFGFKPFQIDSRSVFFPIWPCLNLLHASLFFQRSKLTLNQFFLTDPFPNLLHVSLSFPTFPFLETK